MKILSVTLVLASIATMTCALVGVIFLTVFSTDRDFLFTFTLGITLGMTGLLCDALSNHPVSREMIRRKMVRIRSAIWAILACIALMVMVTQL